MYRVSGAALQLSGARAVRVRNASCLLQRWNRVDARLPLPAALIVTFTVCAQALCSGMLTRSPKC